MAQIEPANLQSLKRKRSASEQPQQTKSSIISDDPKVEIGAPEDQILKSREHYNDILDLIVRFEGGFIPAALSLCKIFCKLLAINEIGSKSSKSGKDLRISNWLQKQLDRYEVALFQMLQKPSASKQSAALTMLMQLVKAKVGGLGTTASTYGQYARILDNITSRHELEPARNLFLSKYLSIFYDIQCHTVAYLG